MADARLAAAHVHPAPLGRNAAAEAHRARHMLDVVNGVRAGGLATVERFHPEEASDHIERRPRGDAARARGEEQQRRRRAHMCGASLSRLRRGRF